MVTFDNYYKYMDCFYRKYYRAVLSHNLNGRVLRLHCKTATQAVEYGNKVADRYNMLFAK